MAALKQSLEVHRQESAEAYKYFMDVTKKCKTDWAEIVELDGRPELTDDKEEKLVAMKHKFNLVLSADYQMGKLIPYWGQSPQPASTCYLQNFIMTSSE